MTKTEMTNQELDQAEAREAHIEAVAQRIRTTFQTSHQLRTWVSVKVLREDVGATAADFDDAMTYLRRFDSSYHKALDADLITFSR